MLLMYWIKKNFLFIYYNFFLFHGIFVKNKTLFKFNEANTLSKTSLAPGDKDGSVVMGMMVIIQDVLALLPNAEVL